MPRPHHTKRDANYADVIAGIEAAGLNTWDLADVGGEVLDILVAGYNVHKHDYEMVMVEIKTSPTAPTTAAEQRVLDANPHTTMIAYCPEDVLRRFGRM